MRTILYRRQFKLTLYSLRDMVTPIFFIRRKVLFGHKEAVNKKQKRIFIFVKKHEFFFFDFYSIAFSNFKKPKRVFKSVKKNLLYEEAFFKM